MNTDNSQIYTQVKHIYKHALTGFCAKIQQLNTRAEKSVNFTRLHINHNALAVYEQQSPKSSARTGSLTLCIVLTVDFIHNHSTQCQNDWPLSDRYQITLSASAIGWVSNGVLLCADFYIMFYWFTITLLVFRWSIYGHRPLTELYSHTKFQLPAFSEQSLKVHSTQS